MRLGLGPPPEAREYFFLDTLKRRCYTERDGDGKWVRGWLGSWSRVCNIVLSFQHHEQGPVEIIRSVPILRFDLRALLTEI